MMFSIRLIIAAFLVTSGTYAADLKLGVVDDPFFFKPNCKAMIRELVPHEKEIILIVEGTITEEDQEQKSKMITVKPLYTTNWIHLDDMQKSKTNVHATVIVGGNIMTADVQKFQDFPYVFLREYEYQEGVLAVNHPVNVYMQKDYRRPDDSIYTERGRLLHTLTMKREAIAVGKVSLCIKEWNIISQWQKKLRHKREFYDAYDIYEIVTKTLAKPRDNAPQHMIEMFNNHEVEELSRTYARKEIKFSHMHDEGPECGSLGRNMPAGIVKV